MNAKDLMNAVGNAADSFIEEADPAAFKRPVNILKICSLAAAAILIVSVGLLFFEKTVPEKAADSGRMDEGLLANSFTIQEMAPAVAPGSLTAAVCISEEDEENASPVLNQDAEEAFQEETVEEKAYLTEDAKEEAFLAEGAFAEAEAAEEKAEAEEAPAEGLKAASADSIQTYANFRESVPFLTPEGERVVYALVDEGTAAEMLKDADLSERLIKTVETGDGTVCFIRVPEETVISYVFPAFEEIPQNIRDCWQNP